MDRCGFQRGRRLGLIGGFNLTELSVVIGIVGTLASLLLPTVSRTKSSSQSLVCKHHLKQLQLAWHLYADDHNDVLPPNNWLATDWGDGCPQGVPAISGAWVLGSTLQDRSGWGISNGVLFPYATAMEFYHCPSDKSLLDGSRYKRRNRSYSASFYMNGNTNKFDPQVKSKMSEIREPSNSYVFLDEHANSIDDGVFFFHTPGDAGEQSELKVDPANRYGGAHWMNMPADRHNRGCNLTFADGHVQHWRWLWPKNLASPDADRDIANDQDYKDYQNVQSGIPDVIPGLRTTPVSP